MSKKRSKVAVRSKREFATARDAWMSLVDAGYKPHTLKRPCHTGTYWRWELGR